MTKKREIIIIYIISLLIGITLIIINKEYFNSKNEYPNTIKECDYNNYLIELEKFNISNNNTNGILTTKGINEALIYAKEQGYNMVTLPKGEYAIDMSEIQKYVLMKDKEGNEWTHSAKGIVLPSDIEFDISDCKLILVPCEDPQVSVITFSQSNNTKIIGGEIIGDRYEHDYGMRINENGNELEIGNIDIETGELIEDSNYVRTKDYIEVYKDWFTGNDEPLPEKFYLSVLENTTKNTVDGGMRIIYCYDKNNNYLGKESGGWSFTKEVNLLPNTAKIKVTFKDEKRLDAKYYITKRDIYFTYEMGSGITITNSKNNEINGTIVRDFIGDCIGTNAPPIDVSVDNLKIINCTLENSRRQGISFVASGTNYLVKNCNIGEINGVDPQWGIDIEHYGYINNVVIDGCNFYDNKKGDIINYNGWDIEVKNSKFTSSISSTFGYNMIIHNNEFKAEPSKNNIVFGFNTNKTDEDGAYFKVYHNIIDGYQGDTYTSILANSEFRDNIVKNSSIVVGANGYNNTYIDSKVRYNLCDYEYENEKLINCILGGENSGDSIKSRFYVNFELINCEFTSGSPSVVNTILKNCNIYNNDKVFCKTWSGAYTLDGCNITTEYSTNIPFVESQGVQATYINCTMNLSSTPFVAFNYGDFKMINCKIEFNQSYEGDEKEIEFFNNVYGEYKFENNKFVKEFEVPEIILPS
ncbi:MAG: right-handed parallel beta-helix repeat-containing protein [Clostridium sp.]|nr:right-handed parallel beta-helix repeat-containing protein [Clostridium sp.]